MRINSLAAALACGVCIVALAAPAHAQQGEYNIPAGALRSALDAYTRQSGRPIIYRSEEVRGARSPGFRGASSAEAALAAILAGTGFSARTDSSGAIAIIRTGASPGEAGAGSAAANNESAEAGAVAEILVTGQRTVNVDIRRSEDDAQPYVVFDQREIERSQATNLEDFFRTRLPMNAVSATNGQSASNLLGNQSTVNLRGLGAGQTLILVDGRRAARNLLPASSSQSTIQADINGIPLAMIERIEVLPATASGIYGGDATGGVINIITRRDYTGLSLAANYGSSFRGDAGEFRFDGAAGFSLEGGRTQVRLTASHAETDGLAIGDRDFVRRGRQLQFANNPAAVNALATPPVGFTSNIRSSNGSNLVLDAQYGGTALNSPRTYVPIGFVGVNPANPTSAAPLVANAGLYNLDLPDTIGGARQSLIGATNTTSASIYVSRDFGPNVEIFGDFSWLDNQAETIFSNVPTSTTLAANAPNNPFTTQIVVSFPATGLYFTQRTRTETLRATAGVIVRLPHNWSAGADYSWSRVRWSASGTFPPVGDPDGSGPGLSVTTALQNGTLDVVRDLNASPLNWGPYLLSSPNSNYGPNVVQLHDATLRLAGPVFRLPGGHFTLTALAGYRSEQAGDAIADTIFQGAPIFSVTPARSQSVTSFYAEARAPLLSPANGIPLLREVEVQASVRHDRYDTRAPTPNTFTLPNSQAPRPAVTDVINEIAATKFTLGVRLSPVEGVTLRASYGNGFLPPTVGQITPQIADNIVTLIDPKRGGVSAPTGTIRLTSLGSPDIVPETSRSWSVGVIIAPTFLRGLRFSADYINIEKEGEIAALTPQLAVDLEDVVPGRVTRAALTPQDQALGYTGGAITAINYSSINIATTRVEAVDFQLDYNWEIAGVGAFRAYAVATYTPTFERRVTPVAALVQSAGYNGSVLRWRGNAGLNWELDGWQADWNVQYYDSYFVCTATAAPTACTNTVTNQGSTRIPRQSYHDLLVSYQFGANLEGGWRALRGLRVTAGIQNIFDKRPPILATTGTTGGFSAFGDPRLRRFTLSLRREF